MASKKGALQRKRQKSGKGGQKPPTRASVQKVTVSPRKGKVRSTKLSQRELARLAQERFKRSLAAKKGHERKKLALLQEQAALEKKKAFDRREKKDRKKRFEDAILQFADTVDRIKAERKKRKLFTPQEAARQEAEIREAAREADRIRKGETDVAERAETRERFFKEVKLGRELLQERIKDFYEKEEAAGKVVPLSRKHKPGRTWRYRSSYREGFVADRKQATVLNAETFESIVERITKTAEYVVSKQPVGKLYMSFSFYEYGRGVPKSSFEAGSDELGQYWQAFDGTGKLSEASSLDEFEGKVREMLHEKIAKHGENHVVLLDGFEVKAFRDRDLDEQVRYRKEKERKRGLARRRRNKK